MASRQLQTALAQRFTNLGWDMARFKGDVLRACSFYCRRPIASAAELTAGEATGLAAELAKLARTVEHDYQMVALADLVGKRFVVASEIEGGKRLAVVLVKEMTGPKFRKKLWQQIS